MSSRLGFWLVEVRPWPVRLLLLILVGIPLFTAGDAHPTIHADAFVADLGHWLAALLFIWLFVALSVGLEVFLKWMMLPVVTGLTMVFTGALAQASGLWDVVHSLTGFEGKSVSEENAKLVHTLIMILATFPYSLLFLKSFPASHLVHWVSHESRKGNFSIVLLAIFIRMLQHVVESVPRTLFGWREENPQMVAPRYRDDWRGTTLKRVASYIDWVRMAVVALGATLAVQSLAMVPGVVRDFNRLVSKE